MLRMGREGSGIGWFGLFRAMFEFRRAAKWSQRPVISADAARARYEPLVESLAAELAAEFGVVFRRTENRSPTRGRRVFETTGWVVDEPLSRFPDWRRRLDAAVRRVADVVGPEMPICAFAGVPTELPPEMKSQLEARGMEGDPFGEAGGDVELVFMSQYLSVRDRLGGDVQVTVDDDQTSLSAIASVKPD